MEVAHHVKLVELADHSLVVALAVGIVKPGNQRIVLCCCGLRAHFDALSALDNPYHVVATGYNVSQWAQATFPQDAVPQQIDESERVTTWISFA